MKKLQVVEPMQLGHHTNYLLGIVPAMQALKRAGVLDTVVVTITPIHFDHLTDTGHVERIGPDIEWDATLPYTSPCTRKSERLALYKAVRRSVDRHRADALICTTADIDLFPNALFNLLPSLRFWPAESAGMVHYGYPKGNLSRVENYKRILYELSWTASQWKKVLMVNPLLHEGYAERGKNRNGRYGLVPDPVPVIKTIARADARSQLGLPGDGILVGCVGIMDHRRAIPELLRAFFRIASDIDPSVRLVLAGRLLGRYRKLIDSNYSDEILTGRLILIDRALTDREVLCGYAALDLHSVLQYRRFNLSANVLKCVASGKPFVCDQDGHAAMVARRFDAGVVCDVGDEHSIADALAAGLRKSGATDEDSSGRRLVEFHGIDNFARVALASVLGEGVYQTLGRPLGWEHVYGHRSQPAPKPQPAATLT